MGPQPGPQTEALASNAEIAVIGGAAGGGKSYTLLMDPLRYLFEVPGFHGVLFRRTFPEIALPGGLWDTSSELYKSLGAIPKKGDYKWLFPFDNTMSMHHLQHDATMYDWQGSQVTYFGWDELTHFKERVFSYITFSRGRSGCDIPSYTRCSCNPDPGWVKGFLAPWVDRTFPDPAKFGDVRWFIRNEKDEWQWVPRDYPRALSLTFIKSKVEDNAIMLAKNPRYITMLNALPRVERERLLHGNWDIRREGLVYPSFDECIVDDPGFLVQPTVGGIDFGFRDPFAAIWGHVDYDGCLWITGCRYKSQVTIPIHSEAIPRDVRYWCDPAEPGLRVELRHAGHDAVPCMHISARGAGGEKRNPLLHGIDLVSDRIRNKRLKVVRNDGTKWLIREAGIYHYDPEKAGENPVDEDNHSMDALRYLIVGLDRGKVAKDPWMEPEAAAERERVAEQAKQAEQAKAAEAALADEDRWY